MLDSICVIVLVRRHLCHCSGWTAFVSLFWLDSICVIIFVDSICVIIFVDSILVIAYALLGGMPVAQVLWAVQTGLDIPGHQIPGRRISLSI